MFITVEELKSAMYSYQVTEITEDDLSISQMGISAAIEEVKSYLRGRYNTNKIFAAEGLQRNALILEITKDIAVWHIIRLANVDMLYEHIKERYDRAINWLKDVTKGLIAPELPLITDENTGEPIVKIKFGSNPKFNHSY